MEKLAIEKGFWKNRRVFVTGHTGFKGGWLTLWLASMGAEVHGYALEPDTDPNFFDSISLSDLLASHTIGDVRNLEDLGKTLRETDPEVIFHLAAQSLVLRSFDQPIMTIDVNVMGTANLLEASRNLQSLRAIVNVTSDKCYRNDGNHHAFKEADPMGGSDPYSASKGAAELIAQSYHKSFFSEGRTAIASARAGNVIGGGDWAANRLIPDYFRAQKNEEALFLRAPNSVRPWQHVLEPLAGYLQLAQALYLEGQAFSGGWNFGPAKESAMPVEWIANYLAQHYGGRYQLGTDRTNREAHYLMLDSSKAKTQLQWHPRWGIDTALDKTAEWYLSFNRGQDMRILSLGQINEYIV